MPSYIMTSTQPTYSDITQTEIFPTRDQAIILHAVDNIKFVEYITALSKVIHPSNIIFSSRISNNRICVYLKSKEMTDNLVQNHSTILVNNLLVRVRRLINPSKRLVISNVSPHIPHTTIEKALISYNLNLTSPISFMKAGLNDNEFKHIKSFRRQVYIQPPNDDTDNVPESLNINYDNETFRIFLSTDERWCSLCKTKDHSNNNCPERGEREQMEVLGNKSFSCNGSRRGSLVTESLSSSDISTSNDVDQSLTDQTTSSDLNTIEVNKPSIQAETQSIPTDPVLLNSKSYKRNLSDNSTSSTSSALNCNESHRQKKKKEESDEQKKLRINLLPAKQCIDNNQKTLKESISFEKIISLINDNNKFSTAQELFNKLNIPLNSADTVFIQLKSVYAAINDHSTKIRITKLTNKITENLIGKNNDDR